MMACSVFVNHLCEAKRPRAVVSEYQPHTKRMLDGVRKRLADGAALENYYPAVIPLALWQRVQEAR